MTSKAALAYVLLNGKTVNIGNIHKLTGYTNSAREIGRSIERLPGEGTNCTGFGVVVTRTKREGKNRYGVYSNWVDYNLQLSRNKLPRIKEMAKYVVREIGEPKTAEQQKMVQSLKHFIR